MSFIPCGLSVILASSKGPPLNIISSRMIPKLYTSPLGLPWTKFVALVRNNSGAVHSNSGRQTNVSINKPYPYLLILNVSVRREEIMNKNHKMIT